MILIGLGANLPSPAGAPAKTCKAALETIGAAGARVEACSPLYESEPVPPSDQPWFVNGVAALSTDLGPAALLAVLLETERTFGRMRGERNAARPLDLDLLAYDDMVCPPEPPPQLPHPRLHERAFVLLPLRDLAPDWRHPVSGRSVAQLIQDVEPISGVRPLNTQSK